MRRIAILLLILFALAAQARIGGGDSYSGDSSSSSDSSSDYSSGSDSSDYGSSSDSGSSSSGGGGGGGGGGSFLMFLFWFGFIILFSAAKSALEKNPTVTVTARAPEPVADTNLDPLRRFDPSFSQIVFTDFCYSLYARVHEARGRGQLDRVAPYVRGDVRAALARQSPSGLTSVDAIVIGSFAIRAVRGLETPDVEVDVDLEANYSEESSSQGTRRWYVLERWTLTRKRDLLSPRPEKAKAEHCPKCGAPLETRTDGACLHCGTVVSDGTFNWFVKGIQVLKKDARSPQLGGPSGPEPGLDRATVTQPWVGKHMKTFEEKHPGFTWPSFLERVRFAANELQAAWTARDWKRARPLETDALFQMHRYWIEEYLRQGLRNVVDSYTVGKIDVVKVASDAFYDAVTVRMYASGNDYTVDDAGNVVGGSSTMRKAWSEYWTFVRGRQGAGEDTRVCPNCGGPLPEGQTAVCEWCGGKVRSGEFPWVLSRIEQDEAYRG